MKRCYLGAGVLAVLLLAGILSSHWLDSHCSQLAQTMLEAAAQEPEEALALVQQAQVRWNRTVTAVLADHQYLERAELAFTQLTDPVRRQDRAEWIRLCLEIAHIFRTLAQDQQLSLENLL